MRISRMTQLALCLATTGCLLTNTLAANAQNPNHQFGNALGTAAAVPPAAYQPQPAKPPAGERVASVFSKNPLSYAWGKLRSKEKKGPIVRKPMDQKHNPISLQNPVQPPTPELLVATARLSEQRGLIDDARQQYQQALTMAPNHVDTRLNAARMEDRQGNLSQAEQLYRQVVSLNPQDATPLNDLALCLARQGRFQESVAMLEQTVAMNPEKALYRNNLATVLVELKRDNEALAQLIAAHGPAVGNFNMGYLLTKSGREDGAAAYYTAAVKIDPTLQQAQAALAKVNEPAQQQAEVASKPPVSGSAAVQAAPAAPATATVAPAVASRPTQQGRYGVTPAPAAPPVQPMRQLPPVR